MEAMLGETGERNREETDNSSCEPGATCVNGEVNGTHEEGGDICKVNCTDTGSLKMVSKCSDKITLNNSVNVSSTEELNEVVSDAELEASDKVPNSEPASVCRDVEREVPGSVGKSDIDSKIPSEEETNLGDVGEDGSSESTEKERNLVKNSDESPSRDCELSNLCDGTISKESAISDDELTKSSDKLLHLERESDPSSPQNDGKNGKSEEIGCVEDLNSEEKSDVETEKDDSSKCDPDINVNEPPITGTKTAKSDSGELNKTDSASHEAPENNSTSSTSNEEKCETSSDPKSEEPAKVKKSRKSVTVMNLTPRRSSRNLNKQKSYAEKEDEPDIQEITPVDPLAAQDPLSTDPSRDDKENSKARAARKNTIVVNDTKRLVEIATGSKGIKGGKKEPTLVIIDTNSILSGRGPVPVTQGSSSPGPSAMPPSIPPPPLAPSSSPSTSGYSVLPIALPAQGLYPPIRVNSPHPSNLHPPVTAALHTRPPAPPQILPTLTDDMYVVEAPSFIVPYVYEKPPIKPLKEYLEQLEKELELDKISSNRSPPEQEDSNDDEKEKSEESNEKRDENKVEKDDTDDTGNKEDKENKTDKDSISCKDDVKNDKDDIKHDKDDEDIKHDKDDEDIKNDKDEDNKKGKNDEENKNSNDGKCVSDTEVKDNTSEKDAKSIQEENTDKNEHSVNRENSEKSTDEQNGENNCKDEKEVPESDISSTKKIAENGDNDNKDSARSDDKPLQENKNPENSSNANSGPDKEKSENKPEDCNKSSSYFDNPLGKFFMNIGINLVQEYVQTDLLRSQKRKRDREGKRGNASTQFAINSLVKNLEFSKENNEPFHLEQKKCEYCSFKTESSLVMAQHLETPHMRNYVYRCNFCPLEVRSPHDILFHMEAEHNVRGRLERAPAFHQCPNCPFEDSQKGKLTRHMLSCAKKHKPDRNQEPPPDWEPPAKIPRLTRSRPTALGLGAAAYQAMAAKNMHPLLPKLVPGTVLPPATGSVNRGRGRPPIHGRYIPQDIKTPPRPIAPTHLRQNIMYRPGVSTAPPQVLLPTSYQIAGSQVYQVVGSQGQMMPMAPSSIPCVPRLALMTPSSAKSSVPTPVALVPNIAASNNSISIQSANKNPTAKLLQQPSISITPLPRQPAGMAPGSAVHHAKHVGHSGHPGQAANKATFVICEICDGYIKDLEQLRNHMQWIHKVKIHPKMIYNRPPLNCQKCQFRFFTDQGLERHLLGSHGLVTSSMQEASNKGKDGGRCPVCGRVYQWKLLNHVARDHNMSLKPAHLSYKCTVCTATFGMYKQFENHVYSAHSVVAKRVIDKKSPQVPRPQTSETLLKPLKINDEITIIPQPARPRPGPANRAGAVSSIMQPNMGPKRFKQRLQQRNNVQVIELEDSPVKKDKATDGSAFQENGEDTLNAVKERLRRRKSLEISQVDSESSSAHLSDDAPAKKRRRNDDE